MVVNEVVMSAMAYRPVWMRYGLEGCWHALIKTDIAIIADLRKPVCGFNATFDLNITGTGLVPGFNGDVCATCLENVLNVKGWHLERP